MSDTQSPVEKHNLQDQVLGFIQWKQPMTMTFVMKDGRHIVFENIVTMTPMITGCYIYETTDGVVYVVPPGNHYYIKQEVSQP